MKVYCMFCLDPSVTMALAQQSSSPFLMRSTDSFFFLKDVKAEWPGFTLRLQPEPVGGTHTCVNESWIIIHFELFVGVEHGAHLLQKGVHLCTTSKPFVGRQTAIIVSVG